MKGLSNAQADHNDGPGPTSDLAPDEERNYWKEHYKSRPYVDDSDTYDDFGPAYAFGLHLFRTRTERVPSDLKCDLADDWSASKKQSSLRWERAKHAAYEAWERLALCCKRE